MKKLDIYIVRQFLVTLSMTLIGFLCVILIVDLIENLDRFIDNSIPAGIELSINRSRFSIKSTIRITHKKPISVIDSVTKN